MRYGDRKILTGLLALVLVTGLSGCWTQDKKVKGKQHVAKPPKPSGSIDASFDLRLSLGSATSDQADVFLLFDDTGSFSGVAPTVIALFPEIVSSLLTRFPDVSFAFGVGRFEDYGGAGRGFSNESTSGRPFILNQPIVSSDTPDFDTLLSTALGNSAPGYGGDAPETAVEALWQIATGQGLDGDGNGSKLDSGNAGETGTQTSPGDSGDVPPFSSNTLPTSGSLGGVGWRATAFKIVILATDVCSVVSFASDPPDTIEGIGGTVPMAAFACSSTTPGSSRFGFISDSVSSSGNTVSGAVAPKGSADILETIDALNALGIQVIGLAPGGAPVPEGSLGASFSPSTFLTALAILTGARDAEGTPMVFSTGAGASDIADAIGQAIETSITRKVDVILDSGAAPAELTVTITPGERRDVGPGDTATFSVKVKGSLPAGVSTVTLVFRDKRSNAVLGTAVVTFPSETRATLAAGSSPNVSIP